MGDVYTEVTQQSWFGRGRNALVGVVFGLLLLVVAFPLLFWNESRAVKTERSLAEGAGAVVEAPADRVEPALDQKLVHVSGRIDTDETLHDREFGVSAQVIRLSRGVQIFQWQERKTSETRKKLGGGTETVEHYNYTKDWSPDLVASSTFKEPTGHENPAKMAYRSQEWVVADAHLGPYKPAGELMQQMRSFTELPIPAVAPLAEAPDVAAKLPTGTRIHLGGYYVGTDPANPQVGDLRIRYQVVNPAIISVLAQQNGTMLDTYTTHAGGSIARLAVGQQSAGEMFAAAQAENTALTWLLRFAGFAMMAGGVMLMAGPLAVLGDVVPAIGSVLRLGTFLVAVVVSSVLSLVTIAVAWIAVRPLLGFALLGAAVVIWLAFRKLGQRQSDVASPPPPPVPAGM